MEKVLDIDKIFDDIGFVVSPGDGEEETVQISKARCELSSRLATIFANDDKSAPSTTSSAEVQDLALKKKSEMASSATIFSSTVYLYVLENCQYVSKGRVGVAVVRSNSSILLVFYNSNKENLLCVLLGDGKIHRIDKKEKYCIVTAASKTFSFVCINDDDEAKLIALLMILCSIKSTVLDMGTGVEVKMGSSIFYDSTKFTFDGTTIEVAEQKSSKHRLSQESNSCMSALLGLKMSGKCLIRMDDKTVFVIHVAKVKNTAKKRKSDISNLILTEEELSHHSGNLMTDVSNVETSENEDSLHNEKNIDKDALGRSMNRMGKSVPAEETYTSPQRERRDSLQPSSTTSTDFQSSNDQQQCFASLTDDHSEKPGVLTDYSVLHRIVGVEIDRLEDRLQMALERIVNGCMNSIRNEMTQIKEKQELLLEKLEDLRNGEFSR